MTSISEYTHEFSLQEPKNIFSLAADLYPTSNNIDKCVIEKIVNERIYKREALQGGTRKSDQVLNNAGKEVQPSDNDKRLEVLSCTIKCAIVVLHPTKNNDVITSIKVLCYDKKEESWSQCIYCIYNEVSNTYSLLQLSDIFFSDEKEPLSIFNSHDPIIENLLRKFVVDVLKYNEEIQFDGSTDIRAAEIPRQESDNLSNLTLPNITYDNSIESFTSNGNQLLPIVTNELFPQPAKGNNDQQVSLVVDRYEFRHGQLPSDDQSILSAVIFLLDRSKSISFQSLYKSVASNIKYFANMNNSSIQILVNNLGLEQIHCDITLIFNALSTLYPEILFCIVSISKIPETNLYKFNQIDIYSSNTSTHKKCMFILYDILLNSYVPLYLYDNETNEEAKINLKYDEFSVPILQQFIQKNFACSNNLHLHMVQPNDDCRIQPTTDLLSLGIIGNVNTLSTVTKQSTKTTSKKCFPLSRTASATASLVLMNNEPNTLVKFVQQKIPRDGHCFYWSMIFLIPELNHMTVTDLRSVVADYVLKSEEMDLEVLCSGTGSNLQEYCYNIKNTSMWADHLEIEAVAQMYNTAIRIVTIEKKNDSISNVSVTETLSGESSFTKCVYLIYIDNNHYEALYLEYDNEPSKTKKIFERNDQTVRELLYEFFKNEYNYHGEIKFFHDRKNEVPSVPVRINPSDIIENRIRKRRIPNENDDQFNKKTTSTEGSIVKYKIEFQKQPMPRFRARMRSDIEPTSKFNKTGQETQLRKPSYMADCENNHCLTLLIPKELLTHNLDYLCAKITIITRCFNDGRAYEHPYLVFLVCDKQTVMITNPLYIHFGTQSECHKLTINADGSAKLKLFLVIIKRKLCELKQIKSLIVFNPSNSNAKKKEIPVTSTHSDEFVKQYDLHKLQLCVTLWKKDSNNGEYHRLDDIPCISQVIEEDKDCKVSEVTQRLHN